MTRRDEMGYIEVYTESDFRPDGSIVTHVTGYDWVGPPVAIAPMRACPHHEYPNLRGQFSVGPYRVEIMEPDFQSLSYVVRRVGCRGWAWSLRWQALRRWQWFAVRWRETLRVWGIK